MPATPAGIILAAGKGTRMRSDLPKVLHPVAGLPMVELVGRAMREAGIERIVVVIGHRGELVQEALGDAYEYAWQREQLGTGHAALMVRDLLGDHDGPILIAPGDAPLLTADVFRELLDRQEGAACTLATAVLDDPTGYGRVVRDGQGRPMRVVEQKDATPDQRDIREVNVSVYLFDGATLFRTLPTLKNSNAQGEYYLTDVVEILAVQGAKVQTVPFRDPGVLVGVNDRWQLASAEKALRLSILKRHALAGVTLLDPDTTFVGPDVKIGPDAVIEAGTQLLGDTKIGAECRIGPYARIDRATVGERATILMSQVVRAEIGNDVYVGPYANIRPHTKLGDGVKVGDFVEIKNTVVAAGAKVPHLSYIGDAEIGERSNIGAGTITCNYDGFEKHRTVIGADVFVGSQSTLVAPITLGDGSMTAAGSVLTKNLPAGAAGFGRARQETKEEWSAKWRRIKQSQA